VNQTTTQKRTSTPGARHRVNFSDENRDLHLQAFFNWLPQEFHEAPHVDWTQLPSRVMGTFVNAAGDSPFAISLALAAFAGFGPMGELNVRTRLSQVNSLLRDVQAHCAVQRVAELTSHIWTTYMAAKELKPTDYSRFKAYAIFTETYLSEYLEKLTPQQYAQVASHILPRLPRRFRQQYLPSDVQAEGEKQRRKAKTDLIAPLHTLLVALVRVRKQQMQRLRAAYREALAQVQTAGTKLPLAFSYEEELITVNREAQTVSDIRFSKQPVTLRFLLWDRQSWVKAHPDDYSPTTKRHAKFGLGEFATQQFFVQCLNPASELLWFGDLIKYRLFQQEQPRNMNLEEAQHRRELLDQLGTAKGLKSSRDGVLAPGHDLAFALGHAMSRTGALVFDVESLARGALFASALTTMALTNGSRMCELLQVSADRFRVRPYIVTSHEHPHGEERVMHLQLLLPKGKHTEAERKLFPISDWSWELLCEIAVELRRAHDNRVPVVYPHNDNTKREDLSSERYLFQWDASPDETWGAFAPTDVSSLLRFILYGLEFRTKEGEPFSVTVHLLRHVMATTARHEHAVPVEAVARVLHHEHRPGMVPVSTAYYSEEPEEPSWVAFASFQKAVEVRAASLLVEWPSVQEISDMDEELRESFERWHTLLETTFGFCGNIDLCPRGYNRTLCIGCPYLVVDPRKRKNALHWLSSYTQRAEELEAAGNEVDARQHRLLVSDLEKHLKDMEFLQAAIEDGTRRPIFLLQPAAPCEGVIVDAEA
jgi:hypothetical protein